MRSALVALRAECQLVHGHPEKFRLIDADAEHGAFLSPLLLRCTDAAARAPHHIEAFGPVSTLIPYDSAEHAIDLAAAGAGSLAGSVVSYDSEFVRSVVLALAPWHGRLLVLDRNCADESTGHGAAIPHAVHGGPGRAGGGAELGGLRAVRHHMQRSAIQGSTAVLSTISMPAGM